MKTKFLAGMVLVLCAAALTFAADGSWTAISLTACAGQKAPNEKHADCAAKCVKEHGAKICLRQRCR